MSQLSQEQSSSRADLVGRMANTFEALRNLIFLTKMESTSPQQVEYYMDLAGEWVDSATNHLAGRAQSDGPQSQSSA